ncbi:hypothetical protein NC651_023426 [Populus alba x Populus x berolinensis]|nr:hypothetical protein NC651_023426 [Populus alba x Populus x berolinensis]
MQKHRNLLYGIMRPVRVFLSIQKCNPNATLLAHRKREKKTSMRRFGKGCNYFGIVMIHHLSRYLIILQCDWSLNHISVSGGEDICIGVSEIEYYFCSGLFFNQGHTDGHLALLHVDTHSLIVGDHCVGIRIPNASMGLLQSRKCPLGHYFWWKYDSFENRGFSAINMGRLIFEKIRDMYLEGLRITSNRLTNFIELAPHVLIPMHGRVNLWPKRMLCGYLKNRRSRELSILEAIENGAKTLIDIVANIYSEVDRSLWLPASSNVRLHVEHLAQQNKLPKGVVAVYVHSLCFEPNITYGNKMSAYWKNGRRGWIDLDYSYNSHIQGGGREVFFFFTRGWALASHPLCLRPCL